MWNPVAIFAAGAVGGFVGTAAANRVIVVRTQLERPSATSLDRQDKQSLQRAVSAGSDAAEVTYMADFRRTQMERFPALQQYVLPDWFISELLWLPDKKITNPNEYRHLTVLINGMKTSDEIAAVDALAAHFQIGNGLDSE